MNLVLNDTLRQFQELANNQQFQDKDRVVLTNGAPAKGEVSVRRLKRREVMENGVSQFDQNNLVRTELLASLKNQFDGTIPASVKRALVGTGSWGVDDMNATPDGRVTGGRPLTMRRIRVILNAVTAVMQNQRANLSVALADGILSIETARALVKDQLRIMNTQWEAEHEGVGLPAGHYVRLQEQIDSTDMQTLARLYDGFVRKNPDPEPADRVERTPVLRERLDVMLSTEEGRERAAESAEGVLAESAEGVPAGFRESFVKFIGRSDVRRQLVELLTQENAPLHWKQPGQWNDAVPVHQLVALWQHEQAAVASEQKVLTDRLASGLVQKDSTVATEEAVNGIMNDLETLLDDLGITEDVLGDEDQIAMTEDLRTAQDVCQQARNRLADIPAGDIASNTNGARDLLAAAVDAEAALAEKITSFVNAVRKRLERAVLAPQNVPAAQEVPDDVISTSVIHLAPNDKPNDELKEPVWKLLVEFENLAMSTQLNAMRLERVGESIAKLGAHPRQGDLDVLESELATLIAGMAPTEAERTAAAEAVAECVRNLTPLMAEVAKLETLPPDAETAELAGRLTQALQEATGAIAGLDGLRGVDPRTTKELRTNLAEARRALSACGVRLRETLLEGLPYELVTILTEGDARYREFLPRLNSTTGELRRHALVLEGMLGRWKSRLNAERGNWTAALIAIRTEINNWMNQDVSAAVVSVKLDLLARSGLSRFVKRYADWEALRNDTLPDEPFSRVDAKLLGMAFRGEISAEHYVYLKSAHYPEEMFRADLVEARGAQPRPVGSGVFNKVYSLDMRNVRTGETKRVVLKDVELSGEEMRFGVAGNFSSSPQTAETGRINFATSKAATLIGCGQQITKCGMVRVGNRFRLAQEFVQGDTFENVIWQKAKVFEMPDPQNPTQTKALSFTAGCEALKNRYPDLLEKLKQKLQVAAAQLEWADLLTGQLDRTLANVMLKVTVTGTTPETMRVDVQLKGIDNDIGFTEGHVSPTLFKCGKDWSDPDRLRFYNALDNGDILTLIDEEHVLNLRMPAFLPLSVKNRLDALDEETYRREMGPLLGKRALDSAVRRLLNLKAMARVFERDGRIVNDLDPNLTRSSKDLDTIVNENEELRLQGLFALRAQVGNLYPRLFE